MYLNDEVAVFDSGLIHHEVLYPEQLPEYAGHAHGESPFHFGLATKRIGDFAVRMSRDRQTACTSSKSRSGPFSHLSPPTQTSGEPYFPKHGGPAGHEAYAHWMDPIDHAGIQPVVVTVVPVTAAHAATHPGRAESLWAFNDALRTLARDRHLPLLDLERALRVSRQHRALRPGLDTGDGLHLKNRTYRERLDHLIPIALMAAWRRAQNGTS